jgi:hypothetical protein
MQAGFLLFPIMVVESLENIDLVSITNANANVKNFNSIAPDATQTEETSRTPTKTTTNGHNQF